MNNKTIVGLVIVALLVGGVAYFGFNKSNPAPTSQEPIKIGIVVYPDSGVFYIAQEEGFFKKEGVNVDLVQIPVDNIFAALQTNQVQMATAFAPDTMTILADAGILAKQILVTSLSSGADGMLVTKNIQKISDLKDKKVYLTLGYPEHFFFDYEAQKAGLAPTDVQLVNLNSEEVGASFVSGKIDAGMTWEPWLSQGLERKDGKILFTSRDDLGVVISELVARNDLVASRREDVKKIMRAYFDAANWWNENVDKGNAIISKNFSLTAQEFAPMKNTMILATPQINAEKFDKTNPLSVYALVDMASAFYLRDGVIKTGTTGEAVTDSSLFNDLHY